MRAFIALPMPEAAIDPLLQLQARLPKGRPVPEENLHLTVAFLGDQPEHAFEAVHEELLTLRQEAISIELAGAAFFGGQHGQALGLEVDGGPGLRDLYDRVVWRVRGAGITLERRRFRPHVTVARLPRGAEPGSALATLSAAQIGPVSLTELALVSSTLREDGAVHEVLASYPLGPDLNGMQDHGPIW